MILARSMLLPPPRPTTASGRKSRAGGEGGGGGPQRRFRLAAGEDLDGDAGLAQRPVDRTHQTGLQQNRIGDDEGAAGAETTGDLAEASGGVAAEDQLAGGMESPGGAHDGLRVSLTSPTRKQGPGFNPHLRVGLVKRYCPGRGAEGQSG